MQSGLMYLLAIAYRANDAERQVNRGQCKQSMTESMSSSDGPLAFCDGTMVRGTTVENTFILTAGSWHWVLVRRDYSTLHPDVLRNRTPCSCLPAT